MPILPSSTNCILIYLKFVLHCPAELNELPCCNLWNWTFGSFNCISYLICPLKFVAQLENLRTGENNNNSNNNKSDINKCWAYFLWQVCAALSALLFFVTLAPEWPTGLRVQFRVRDSVSGLSMPSNRRRCLEEQPLSSPPDSCSGGGGCCSWHLLAFLSRAFLKCLPFRPRNPCRNPSTPPRQVSLTF